MVLGLLHQALHLQQIGQLTAGADGEREIPGAASSTRQIRATIATWRPVLL